VNGYPIFNHPAQWIIKKNYEKAKKIGYTVVDNATVIITHLHESIKNNAGELLTREEVNFLIDFVGEKYPYTVEELLHYQSITNITKILKNLLAEKVSIHNVLSIFESIADYGVINNTFYITEKVRENLGKEIYQEYLMENNILNVLILEENIFTLLNNNLNENGQNPGIILQKEENDMINKALNPYKMN
jgi:flagellar biosynthesis protein FlhA